MLANFGLKIRPFWDSDYKNWYSYFSKAFWENNLHHITYLRKSYLWTKNEGNRFFNFCDLMVSWPSFNPFAELDCNIIGYRSQTNQSKRVYGAQRKFMHLTCWVNFHNSLTVKGRRKIAMNQSTGNEAEPLNSDGYVILWFSSRWTNSQYKHYHQFKGLRIEAIGVCMSCM